MKTTDQETTQAPVIDESLPEIVKNFLRQGGRLESIRLHADGHWSHQGHRIENPRILALFNRSIERTEGGTWILHIKPFTYPIEVEDTPYFIEQIAQDEEGLLLTLSDRSQERLDTQTLEYASQGRLYCEVKRGQASKTRARFLRQPYYELAERVELDERGHLCLMLPHTRVDLGPAPDEG